MRVISTGKDEIKDIRKIIRLVLPFRFNVGKKHLRWWVFSLSLSLSLDKI
jgi:hypothetical protein